ncbi:PREDICTED: H-2 class II histocompatibility antigen, A-U alpha chain-like isoform X1 [Cyprinodon variegatus]|uniref:H-2 class II histocompatibility antigen, A-U alpha chain-like n=1 Tax=Cyprinodon variegatus TaxID=28743 RepID=A0A3Q2CP85_CYPVA|nr:PREDICTED: H-2 class II histocompatibility antigen, A-U alpha chain-like isoform X1 [Cyprinodon variegatus]
MKCFALLILFLNAVYVASHVPHEITYFVGCFENGTTVVQFDFDGEEILYVDLQREEVVITVPVFIDPDPMQVLIGLSILKDALDNKEWCSALQRMFQYKNKSPPKEDPPDTMIFPSREIELEMENSLVCFVNNFYPPLVKVSWTKNGHPVSEGVSVGQYHPNKDQTFCLFSTLRFTPSEGDIYSCTVEHPALETPKTRIWETEIIKENQSLGPDIYCGVGLCVGSLGIATGVFFIVKSQHLN